MSSTPMEHAMGEVPLEIRCSHVASADLFLSSLLFTSLLFPFLLLSFINLV